MELGQLDYIKEETKQKLCEAGEIKIVNVGERVTRGDEYSNIVYFIVEGSGRIIGDSQSANGLITIGKIYSGEWFGWAGILRGKECETVQCVEKMKLIKVPSELIVELWHKDKDFYEFFICKNSVGEIWDVLSTYLSEFAYSSTSKDNILLKALKSVETIRYKDVKWEDKDYSYYLSTGKTNLAIGTELSNNTLVKKSEGFRFNIRVVKIKSSWLDYEEIENKLVSNKIKDANAGLETSKLEVETTDLAKLGVIEYEDFGDSDKFPLVRGKGMVEEGLAIVEMICKKENIPIRKELVNKFLTDQKKRGKDLCIENLGGLCEALGCQTQIGVVKSQFLQSVEFPAIHITDGYPEIYWEVKNNNLKVSSPRYGFKKIDISNLEVDKDYKLLLVKRSVSANTVKFGWSWFIPLVNKYKWALALVFAATMLAQLMGLAIPLLLQQIIDKVLSQGNVSTLNVLGGTMVVLALFSGLLTALRQFIFVDTTDRMDLTLGSAVIDRLLSLPLRYFEKRPVGELSQRLGELNNIRGFLTGTALISVMNLFFALMYLIVMIIYSPLLTAVALSTFPIYMALVLIIAPVFKQMIRKKAVAQAKTQSHLIEILTGIQTVKAQNAQLTARWKWQDRYKDFVNQGFRAVTVGTVSGQTGGFLSQLSSLMIIWVGMIEILNGNLTLGQLIAFRIIAGNVTGPLLQLSSLWQGFQGVQLSMERLGDILNQTCEQTEEEANQIALPPIKGNIRYEDVKFRFANSGPYQVDSVSIEFKEGSFVGIVGQSGSGKSTLMKLIPRLYRLNGGSIYIDNYDIGKVELGSLRKQVGMVPQDSLLFEGTIAENIALNDPTADDKDIIEAANIACAHEFVMGLPQGYATMVAERGSNLSGGQRQRIAIARTILDNPQLLIMDEATSALDYETERMVCLNIQKWSRGKTVLFITHRLNTIKSADQIIMMHKGKIVENGKHEELMNGNGRYALLFEQQGFAEDI